MLLMAARSSIAHPKNEALPLKGALAEPGKSNVILTGLSGAKVETLNGLATTVFWPFAAVAVPAKTCVPFERVLVSKTKDHPTLGHPLPTGKTAHTSPRPIP